MFQKVTRFFDLSPEEKKLFFEAFALLGLMRLAILTISFKRLTRSLHCSRPENASDSVTLTNDQLYLANLVGKAITRSAGSTPWKSSCLVQCLTAQKMLKRRHIPGCFFLGFPRERGGKDTIDAHAWSQCGDEIITGGCAGEDFTVLSVFKWGTDERL